MATDILTVTTSAVTRAGERLLFPYPNGTRAGDYNTPGAVLKVDGVAQAILFSVAVDVSGLVVTPASINDIPAGTLTLEVPYTPAVEPTEFVRLPGSSVDRALGEWVGDFRRSRVQIVASRGRTLGGSPDGGGGMNNYTRSETRFLHRVGTSDITNIQTVYGAYAILSAGGGETASPNPITVESATEITSPSAQAFQNYVRGQKLFSVDGGAGVVLTDPLGITIPANSTFWTRSAAVVQSGQFFPRGSVRGNTGENAYESTNIASQVFGTGALSNTGAVSASAGYIPLAILGVPKDPFPAVILLGDSLQDGTGETVYDADGNFGFSAKALAALGIPFLKHTRPGDQAQYNVGTKAYRKRTLWRYATHMIDNLGTNDLGNGRTLTQLQADKLEIWAAAKANGLKIYSVLLFPKTTSTDGWATAVNQTYVSRFEPGGLRDQYNAWVRSQVGVTIDGCIDCNQYVEDPANPGKWLTNGSANYPTTDGVHPTTALHTLAVQAVTATAIAFTV